jgi:hypothetical protein
MVEITKGTDYTLAAADSGKRLVATAALTFTLPTVGTLGNGFQAELVNDSGGTVTVVVPGQSNVSLDDADVVRVLEENGKQKVVWIPAMAKAKISAMTVATSLGSTDQIPILQGGVNKSVTPTAAGLVTRTTASLSDPGWEAYYDADSITPVADGASLATVADLSGHARTMTSSGGSAFVYRTAANGINGHPTFRGQGTGYLRSTLGGAALANDFWMLAVVRFNQASSTEHAVCFGDTSGTGKRRGIIRYTGITTDNTWGFNGQSADTPVPPAGPTDVLATGTTYILEVVRSGRTILIYRNGLLIATGTPALVAYSSTAVTIGANTSNGENAHADFGFVGLMGSVPTAGQRADVLATLAARYGITLSTTVPTVADKFSAAGGKALSGSVYADDGSNALIASPLCAGVVTTPYTVGTYTAAASVGGVLVAQSLTVEHQFILNKANSSQYDANVVAVQHLDVTGVSGIRFRSSGSVECGAIGYGNASVGTPSSLPFADATFIETSNIPSGGSPTTPKPFRLVYTNGTGSYRRLEIEAATGDVVFYQMTAVYPGEVEMFRVKANGAVHYTPRSAPSSPTEGDMYYDSTAHKLKVYTGSGWETITSA